MLALLAFSVAAMVAWLVAVVSLVTVVRWFVGRRRRQAEERVAALEERREAAQLQRKLKRNLNRARWKFPRRRGCRIHLVA